MDVTGYRNSGELSDITVVVDGEEFNLHKFPLFVRSEYFRNLSSASTDESTPSRITLDNFPGGAAVFAIVADYCYNKEVKIDADNVIETICAAEYLKMTGGLGRGGLAMVANNILFDLTFLSRNKRDYKQTLKFIETASKFVDVIEACGVSKKLIDTFVETLVNHVKSSGVYESINLYTKAAKSNVAAYKSPKHNLVIEDDQLDVLNNLPLKWINDIIRCSIRYGMNQALISYIIQNYIDYNTSLNPNYKQEVSSTEKTPAATEPMVVGCTKVAGKESGLPELSESVSENHLNLLQITGDILMFKRLVDEKNKEEDGAEENRKEHSSNLSDIDGDILTKESPDEKPNPLNLLKIAGDIFSMAEQMNKKLTEEKGKSEEAENSEQEEPVETENSKANEEEENEKDEASKEKSEEPVEADSESSDLKDVLLAEALPKYEPEGESDAAEKPLNLVAIAGGILSKETEQEDEKSNPISLIKIASEIFSTAEHMKSMLMEEKNERMAQRPELSDPEKLEVISNLINILVDLRIDPQFPIPWLLNYSERIRKLNAETYLKGAFSRWAWNGLTDPKSDPDDLANIPPASMIQLTTDVMADTELKEDANKLGDVIDRYTSNLNAAGKLDADSFAKLSAIVPKNKRNDFNQMTTTLLSLLEKEKIDCEKQTKLFGLVDFQKLNEKTLEECKNSQYIPQNIVTEAALSLCAKLRKELNELKLLNKPYEVPIVNKNRSSTLVLTTTECPITPEYRGYTTTTKYRSPSRNRAELVISEARSKTPTPSYTPSTLSTIPVTTRPSRNTPIVSSSSAYKPTTHARDTSNHNHYRSVSSTRYSSTTKTSTTSPTILNSTYKSNNYNPSTSYSNHRHSTYLDYMDDGLLDSYVPTSAHYDDSDYYCPTHGSSHYQYYSSRIY